MSQYQKISKMGREREAVPISELTVPGIDKKEKPVLNN